MLRDAGFLQQPLPRLDFLIREMRGVLEQSEANDAVDASIAFGDGERAGSDLQAVHLNSVAPSHVFLESCVINVRHFNWSVVQRRVNESKLPLV